MIGRNPDSAVGHSTGLRLAAARAAPLYSTVLAATILFAASPSSALEFDAFDLQLPPEPQGASGEPAQRLEFQDVWGGPELEILQLHDPQNHPAWSIWSINVQARRLDPVATLHMPMETIATQPLLVQWAPPQRGAKAGLFVLAPDSGWLLTPDFPRNVFSPQRIFSTPTALTETDQKKGVVSRPIAFDADGDGAAEIYSFSEQSQSLWRRKADGSYGPVALPPPAMAAARADAGLGFYPWHRPRGASASGQAYEELELNGYRTLSRYSTQFQDIDFDGRLDLVWEEPGRTTLARDFDARGGRFAPTRWSQEPGQSRGRPDLMACRQRPDGEFAPPAALRPAAFDWLAKAQVSGPLNFDGDSEPDYLALRSMASLSDPRTTIAVQYGRELAAASAAPPRHALNTSDPFGLIWIGDVDGDGIQDLCTTVFNYLVFSSQDLVEYFLRDDATYLLRTYYGVKGRGLGQSPDDTLELKSKTAVFGPLAPPFDLSGDFDGDGKRDLLVRRSETQIDLHLLSGKSRKFQKSRAFEFSIPNEQPVLPLDLNGDGRTDLVCPTKDPRALRVYLSQAGAP